MPKPKTSPKPKKPEKETRAPRGTGTVFWSAARGKYVARKPVGTKVVGGRRRTLYVERTGATQSEAIRRRDAAAPPDPVTTTLAEWAERWLGELPHKPLTIDGYTHNVRAWIVPALGPVRVRALTPHMIESAARKWEGALGANTIRLVLSHLRACLAAAVRAGLRTDNPVAAARKPRAVPAEISPYSPAELAQIIRAAAADPRDRVVAALAATGCRRGEAIALLVGDFDPKAGTVAITKTDVGRHGVGPPKSPQSVRTITVPEPARPALVAAAGKRGASEPLFPGRGGGRLSDSTVADRWFAVLERAGLPRRNLHQLRHSVATALVSAGVPLGDVARYLGDRVETVVRTYLHPTGADPAPVLERLLGGGKVAAGRPKPAPEPRKRARRGKGS